VVVLDGHLQSWRRGEAEVDDIGADGPDTRLSRPSTTARDFPFFGEFFSAHAPNAAA
jgi:hypothetical protein